MEYLMWKNISSQRRIIIIVCFAISALLLLATSRSYAAEPIGKRIVLVNGMVLLLSEKHDIPMVTMNIVVKAGNTAAPDDKPGLASVTASLLIQGTTRRTAAQISEEIDFIGGSLTTAGGDDFSSASLRVLKKDLKTGLELLSDILIHPLFEQKEIDRKIKAMLAEIQRQKDEPSVIAREIFKKTVFGRHPYGVTGDDMAAYLPKLTRNDLLAFHASHYGPENAIIAVVGDVTEREIVKLLNDSFKQWRRKKQTPRVNPEPPVLDAVFIKKIDKDITQANIILGHLGTTRTNPDYYALLVMNYILGGGGFSSRLMDNIRDNKGLAYDVHSALSAQKEPGDFSITIQTKNESANLVIEESLGEIRRIQTFSVSDKELADAKAYLTGSFPMRMDTYAKIAAILTSIEIYGLGLDYPSQYQALISSISKDDILRVAKKYLHPDKIVIVVVAKQDEAKLRTF